MHMNLPYLVLPHLKTDILLKCLLLFMFAFSSFFSFAQTQTISLAGKWKVKLDAENEWINCNNASINNLVVQMKIGEPRIEADDFCVKLYFKDAKDSLKISSLLIYNLLGIME